MQLLTTLYGDPQLLFVASLLEQFNIPFEVKKDDCAGLRPQMSFAHGIKIFVSENKLEEARSIMHDNEIELSN